MRWKSIIKAGIIITVFFMMTIECKTDIIATQPANKTVKLFLGDFDQGEVVCEDYVTKRQPNENDEAFLTRLLKIPSDQQGNYILGIPNDARIKELKLDKKHDCIAINMTKDYESMNYGSLAEYLALQSLLNTVTYYYNVHKAVIEVDGKPYASGHIEFQKGEVIDVSGTIR